MNKRYMDFVPKAEKEVPQTSSFSSGQGRTLPGTPQLNAARSATKRPLSGNRPGNVASRTGSLVGAQRAVRRTSSAVSMHRVPQSSERMVRPAATSSTVREIPAAAQPLRPSVAHSAMPSMSAARGLSSVRTNQPGGLSSQNFSRPRRTLDRGDKSPAIMLPDGERAARTTSGNGRQRRERENQGISAGVASPRKTAGDMPGARNLAGKDTSTRTVADALSSQEARRRTLFQEQILASVAEEVESKDKNAAPAKKPRISLKSFVRPGDKNRGNGQGNANEDSDSKTPRSPFINTENLDKRPLSGGHVTMPEPPEETREPEEKKGPVTIIAKPEKDSKAGLIVAIILTIILGAAAGTIAFLLLPK